VTLCSAAVLPVSLEPFVALPIPAHKLLPAEFDWVQLVQGSLEERLESAGGVSSSIVDAFRAVLQDSSLDGVFVSAAITLPASTELRDDIPHMNPVLLYQVRCACKPCLVCLDPPLPPRFLVQAYPLLRLVSQCAHCSVPSTLSCMHKDLMLHMNPLFTG